MTTSTAHDHARHPLPAGFRWPDGVRAAAMFTFDVDAEAVMLTDHPETADYLDVMAHQRYGPQVAVPRLLRILDRLKLRTTFFMPGWVVETWPSMARSVRDAGHEIGHHGYLHESVRGKDEATEEGYLLRGLDAIDTVLGLRPIGYRPPSCDINYRTPSLLARHGFRYDSGLMDSDYPYRLGTGTAAAAADGAGSADGAVLGAGSGAAGAGAADGGADGAADGAVLGAGSAGAGDSLPAATSLIELPMHWSLDDWNRYNYVPGYASSPILRPSVAVDAWAEELVAIVDVGGLFDLAMHPFVSGRPARAVALESLIERTQAMDGVWVAAADEIAAWVESLDLEPVVHEPPRF